METKDELEIENWQDILWRSMNTIRPTNTTIDSLHDELFNAKVEAGRYELSLEHLYEVNPKAGKEFQDFMEHETE